MPQIKKNINLKPYNTFGIEAIASIFVDYTQPKDITYLLDNGLFDPNSPFIILGGGSNQLFTRNYEGLILHPVNRYIEKTLETDEHVYYKVGAGIEWDAFVDFAVKNNLGGIENLSLIPGNVGAAPVQNIGAYGVEAKDTIHEVHIVQLNNGKYFTLNHEDCAFNYRDSIFKQQLKNKVIVDSVTFRLTKKPVFTINYGSVQEELEKLGEINLQSIRSAIITIRESKLPDPEKTGNCGSFFKNPVIADEQVDILKRQFPEMVTYPMDNGTTKIAAGWLIDNCGLKGFVNKKGSAGVHDKQALVIVNKGDATGKDILEVAEKVQHTVADKYGIELEPEVIVI